MDFQLPELGEGVYEAELLQWKVAPGDEIRHGQALMEVMTDKATMEVPSPFAGTIDALLVNADETISIGQRILSYTPAGGNGSRQPAAEPTTEKAPAKVSTPPAAKSPAPATPQPAAPRFTPKQLTKAKASPSVRRLARNLSLDLDAIPGSGPGGRVLIDDLTRYLQTSPTSAPAGEEDQLYDFGQAGTTRELKGLRKLIAERMESAFREVPQVTYVEECDVTQLVQLRNSLRNFLRQEGVKLTYLSFVVKAVVNALQQMPILNATWDRDRKVIHLHDYYHIGVATSTPRGLMVPVIRDADKKPITDIAREIGELSHKAREGTLTREQLTGSTFSVTSIGNIGGLFSTPVINQPEVAILGLGRIVKRPVYNSEENLYPAQLMYFSLTFDHRVFDGDLAAIFCNKVSENLQNPARWLLR